MRRTVPIILAAIGVVLLSACTITVEPTPPPQPDERVTAERATADPAAQPRTDLGTLRDGRSLLIQIDVPAALASEDMLHVEIDRNLLLQLQGSNRQNLAVSRSRTHFAFSSSALAGASSQLESQAIIPRPSCGGSCILHEPSGVTRFFARVTNNSGADMPVNLLAYVEPFADEYEAFGNDRIGNAVPLGAAGGFGSFNDSGAIEVLGDVDYWRVTGNATLTFDAIGGAAVEAVRVAADGTPLGSPLESGVATFIGANQILKVWSPAGRAGNADGSASLYFLSGTMP